MLYLKKENDAVVFRVFVQPKSSKNMICGLHGDAVKVKLTAPPVDGAANKMCIQFLSKCFKVSKSSIEIRSGHTGRTKLIHITTPDPDLLASGILSLIDKNK